LLSGVLLFLAGEHIPGTNTESCSNTEADLQKSQIFLAREIYLNKIPHYENKEKAA
jgi:hypothetical protein